MGSDLKVEKLPLRPSRHSVAQGAAALVFCCGVVVGVETPIFEVPLGSLKIILLPLSASFIAALGFNVLLFHYVGDEQHQRITSGYSTALGFLLLPFIVKLGTLVGQSQDVIVAAGPALILQEAGHFLGTLVLSMPVALFVLKLRREAVGACFSIAREGSVAIISERYGIRSPEGIGVMAVYVAGTLFGTIIFSILASAIVSIDFFDYRALAVACGIGSGSMTAACAGSLAALLPQSADEILGLAAASNLLSAISGFYLTLFVTLPLANWFYRLVHGAGSDSKIASLELRAGHPVEHESHVFKTCLGMLAIGISTIAATGFSANSIEGLLWLAGLSGFSLLLGKLGGKILSSVFWASALGAIVTLPISPVSATATAALRGIDILVLAIVPLSAAALTLGSNEWRVVRTVGWKLLIVSLLVFVGTFLGAAIIAEVALGIGE